MITEQTLSRNQTRTRIVSCSINDDESDQNNRSFASET